MALASCGSEEQKAAPGPKIAVGVAEPLAKRSEQVASLLERGDECGARAQAALLRREVTEAINSRSIPDAYLEDLSGVVNEIEAQIPPCEPMIPPPRKKQDEDDEGDD